MPELEPDLQAAEPSLTRREAELAIDARLAALGHAPGFLSAAARDELVARSGGSPQALRRALSASLFLAATEELTEIAAPDVCRALPAEPLLAGAALPAHGADWRGRGPIAADSGAERPSGRGADALALDGAISGRLRRRRITPIGALSLCAAAALTALYLGLPLPSRRPHPPVERALAVRVLPPPRAAVAAPGSLAPATAPGLVEAPADLGPLAGLPVDPPGRITLLLPSHAKRPLEQAAYSLREQLQGAGLAVLAAERPAHGRICPSICFFYEEDRALAEKVANLAGAATNFSAPQNPRRPVLFIQPSASPVQRPGSVTVNLF